MRLSLLTAVVFGRNVCRTMASFPCVFVHAQVSDPTFGNTRDLWEDDHPAWGKNGTYGTVIYTREAVATVDRFAPQLLAPARSSGEMGARAAEVKGLFIYLA